MKVIPFSLFVRDVNLCSSFEYSILRELSNLLGRPQISPLVMLKKPTSKSLLGHPPSGRSRASALYMLLYDDTGAGDTDRETVISSSEPLKLPSSSVR